MFPVFIWPRLCSNIIRLLSTLPRSSVEDEVAGRKSSGSRAEVVSSIGYGHPVSACLGSTD